MKTTLILTVAAVLLAASGARAAIVNYDVSGDGPVQIGTPKVVGGLQDSITLDPFSGSFVVSDVGFSSGSGIKLNDFHWTQNAEANGQSDGSITRYITILAANQTLSQPVRLVVGGGSTSQSQNLTIFGAGPAHFTWMADSKIYDLNIYARGVEVQNTFGIPGSASYDGVIEGWWTCDVTPVPEPSTVIAGALLLLPFGVSAFRSVRRNRE